MNVTKKEFEAYERVRKGGRFNMITDLYDAARAARLSNERYVRVMRYYTECADKWPDVVASMENARHK